MTDVERTESEGFYEMLWDCTHCGTKDLLGKSQRHCPECGAPQDPATRHFPKEGEAKEVAGHQYEGGDRRCPACATPQGAKGKNCTHCGAPLDGGVAVPLVATSTAPMVAKRSPLRAIVIGLLVFAALGTVVYLRCIRTASATLTVAGHRWQRTIAIEEFATHHEATWRDQLPGDARVDGCTRRPHSSRQIPDGETCTSAKHDRGDGTFEKVKTCKPKYRSESIDADYCSYTIDRWQPVDKAVASGVGMSPTSPNPPSLGGSAGLATIGARRLGALTETLTVDFRDGTRTQSCDVAEAIWRKYVDGQPATVQVRAASGDLVCGSL
jgi:hypothetical protein